MILENYKYLSKVNIGLHNALKNWNPSEGEKLFDYSNSSVNYICDGVKVQIHSSKPEVEANVILNKYDIDNVNEIVVFGIGDGTLLKNIFERVDSKVKVYVIDFIEVLKELISHVSFSDLGFDKICSITLISSEMNLDSFYKIFFNSVSGPFELIILPQYQRLFRNNINTFVDKLAKSIHFKTSLTKTNSVFEKRWIINSLKNFNVVLKSTNITSFGKYDFSKSVAIIIGAGPSLDYDIEYLKELKKLNNVYIFGVGSANKTLLHNGITPDAIFTYDPSSRNKEVLEDYVSKSLDVPIIFGSTVGYETLQMNHDAFQIHILLNQDSLFSALLGEEFQKYVVSDTPNVSILTFESLVKIGFKEIILSGQNLGFHKFQRHASGINYSFAPNKINKDNIKEKKYIKDVYGNDMLTDKTYIGMKNTLEETIKKYPEVKVYNSTKYGAMIKGTDFLNIEDFIELSHKYVKPVLFEQKDSNLLDHLEIFKKNMSKLEKSRLECKNYLIKLDSIFKEIRDSIRNNDYKKITNYDLVIEKILNKLLKNLFYIKFLRPMSRNYIHITLSNLREIKFEKDSKNKAALMYDKLGALVVENMKDYNIIINDFVAVRDYLR